MKKIILLLALTIIFTSISCSGVDDNYKATLRKVFEATGSEEMYKQAIKMMIPMLKPKYPELNTESFDLIEKEILKTSIDSLVDMLVPVYFKYYSQSELEEILKFYQSQIGKKYAKNSSIIMRESVEVGKNWGILIGNEFERKVKELNKVNAQSKSKSNSIEEIEFLSNVTNLEKNLFDGKNYGELTFKPLIDSHIKRLIYNINNPWIKSDIILKKDSSYYINVCGYGSTSRRKVYLWTGPEGATSNYISVNYPNDSLAPFSIIGKLGTHGKIFCIGNSIELKPNENNELFIGYNDNLFEDNIGYFIIDIFKGKKEDVQKSLELSKNKIGKFYGETKKN